MRPLEHPADVKGFEIEPLDDLARADALVARRIDDLGLPTWPVDAVDAHVAVHEDAERRAARSLRHEPRRRATSSSASRSPRSRCWSILLGDARVTRTGGAFEIPVPARSVRMMGVEGLRR